MDFVIALERTHVGVKGVAAVEFDHLPDVPQVVKGKLVQQLVESDNAKCCVPSGALANRNGHRIK